MITIRAPPRNVSHRIARLWVMRPGTGLFLLSQHTFLRRKCHDYSTRWPLLLGLRRPYARPPYLANFFQQASGTHTVQPIKPNK